MIHVSGYVPIVLQVMDVTEVLNYVTAINSTDFVGQRQPEISLLIPPQLISMFTVARSEEQERVRLVSALYFNVESLFPDENSDEYK